MIDFGTVKPGTTLYIPFHTFDSNDPSNSVTITGLAVGDIAVYKDGGTTARASTSGYALLGTDGIDEFGGGGLHGVSVNLADNTTADFYEAGSQYWVRIGDITVDAGTVRFYAATFRIGYPGAVLDTVMATRASQTEFTLEEGPAEDDALNGCICWIHDAASAVQCAPAVVQDYVGSTRTVTLVAGPTFTTAQNDNVSFFPPALTPTTLGTTLDVSATGEAGVDWNNVGTPGATVDLSATSINLTDTATAVTNAVTVGTINTDVVNATALATDAVNEIRNAITGGAYALNTTALGNIGIDWANVENPTSIVDLSATDIQLVDTATTVTNGVTVTTNNDKTGYSISGAKTTLDALNDVAATDIVSAGAITTSGGAVSTVTAVTTVNGLADGVVPAIFSGTTEAGGSTTTLVDTALTEIDDTWNGCWVYLTSGTDANRVRLITDFANATGTITFAPAVSASIGAGVTYKILPAGGVDVQSWIATESAHQAPNALVAGAVDADVSAMQANVLTASALATDAVNEIVDQTWDEAQADHVGAGSMGLIASEIADILVDTAEIGAAGAGLTEAGGTGDQLTAIPWNAAWDAEVQSEVDDALDTAISELSQAAPTATPTLRTAIMLLYMMARNKLVVQTSGTDAIEVYNDAGTLICKKLITDSAGDYTEAEMTSGP